jgi:transposase-like protein
MEDYPRTLLELEKRFSTEDACREYLFKLRWPEGFLCPRCGGQDIWQMQRGLSLCRVCRLQVSVTAGTIFQGSRLPLTLWFRAMWFVTSQKNGASALALKRTLGFGSYQTAWVWLHKLRRAMIRPGRDHLRGTVEVDETYVGGETPGKRGRGALGKALVMIAVEIEGDKIGRIRLVQVPDASRGSLEPALKQSVDLGSTVRTDDWSGYRGLRGQGFKHKVVRSFATVGEDLLPNCHMVASLLKRWLLGTHQGAISHQHLPYYLDEFTFRFNRRTSASRGKLFYRLVQQCLQVDPVPYKEIVRSQDIGGS